MEFRVWENYEWLFQLSIINLIVVCFPFPHRFVYVVFPEVDSSLDLDSFAETINFDGDEG